MVDRVGEWFAFSRTSYCRRLTLYEQLPWGTGDAPHFSFCPTPPPPPASSAALSTSNDLHGPRGFSLATADLVAVARFGGLVAVYGRVHSTAGLTGPSIVFSSDSTGAPVQQFNLSAHSAAVAGLSSSSPAGGGASGSGADKVVQVYTSGGELLALLPLTTATLAGTDAVVALGWTGEGELYVLLAPSLTVVFLDTRDIAVDPLAAPAAAVLPGGEEARVTRRVSLRSAKPVAASLPSGPLAGLRATPEGILCVEDIDGRGLLHSLLHEEKFTSLVLASVPLPVKTGLTTFRAAAAPLRARPVVLTSPAALDMVPPAWNDSGDLVVLWAQPGESNSSSSVLCAMAHPNNGSCSSDYAVGGAAQPVVRRMACPGRVLELAVCVAEPTQVAVFTSRGVLHVFRSNLESALFGLDLGVCRVLRTAAALAQVHDSGSTTASFATPSGASFSAGAATSTSFASGGGMDAASDGATAAAQRNGNTTATAAAADHEVDCPAPYKVEWCGRHFVLLHFYEADLEAGGAYPPSTGLSSSALTELRQERPMLSLLACTQYGCSVRCERLGWGDDGSGHIATVAEFDGVRVMTDTTCYALQEVPACLARLCRVQPPFSPAAQVVLAYEAYTSGDRHGIAQVRAALAAVASPSATDTKASPLPSTPLEGSPDTAAAADGEDDDNAGGDGEEAWATTRVEGLVCDLLDAASHEFDVARQHLLIAAASFAGETTHLRSGVPDIIVDVARRLRVLRAVRTEPRCHMPITMEQYQLLTGSQERPARGLTRTEGQVLVDRLTYLGHYQTALDVARAMHMKAARVLARWAASFIRRHADRMSDSTLYREVAHVLRKFPDASYVEPAATAFVRNRRELALLLLRDEPQQQRRRVLLCVELGELSMAGRAAAASGSAELIHLVVSALVAREAQSRGAAPSRASPHASNEVDDAPPLTLSEVQHCLIASPELLCWLLVGASSLSAWQAVAERVLFTAHWSLAALECHAIAVQCLRQSTTTHRSQLKRLVLEHRNAAVEPVADEEATEEAATRDKDKQRKRRHFWRTAGDTEPSADSGDENDAASPTAAVSPLPPPPPLAIPCPTAAVASAAFALWTRKTKGFLHSTFQRADEMRRDTAATARGETPFAALLSRAERLREAERTTAQSGPLSAALTVSDGSSGDRAGAASTTSSILPQEGCVRTVLAAPASRPSRDAAALARQVKLERLRLSLAAKHNAPRLTRCVVSVVDLVHELCAIPDAADDVAEVQRTFAMPAKMLFFAQLRGFCAAQRWDALDGLVGPAPALQKKSFFSSGDSGAHTPCIGYLPVVQLLAQHGQHERAARYVAGACAEVVDRVSWYMSLGAPVMALEAAMVERDGGLIAQVMQRMPDSATVQSVGGAMLTELRQS